MVERGVKGHPQDSPGPLGLDLINALNHVKSLGLSPPSLSSTVVLGLSRVLPALSPGQAAEAFGVAADEVTGRQEVNDAVEEELQIP